MPEAESPELGPMIASLDASFEASVARSEEEAASDLALSLRQGRTLAEVLLRSHGIEAHLPGGARFVVTAVGDDFLGGGEPLSRAVPWTWVKLLACPSAAAPTRYRGDLIGLARQWMRRGARVEIMSEAGGLRGPLAEVGSDYLCVTTAAGPGYVPRAGIKEFSLLGERTAGGF